MKVFMRILQVCLLLAMTAPSLAAAPNYISYQARLTTASGTPVANGAYGMTFRIYDDPVTGILLWAETQPAVSVQGGLFSVTLGSVTPLPDTLLNGNDRYLEVQVGTEVISPRTTVISQPYSLRVQSLEGAAGGEVTGTVDFPIEGLTGSGDAITITDSTGNMALSISANAIFGAATNFYDPVDSKGGSKANELVVHVGSDGISMYDPTPYDSTISIKPDGHAYFEGPVQITQGGTVYQPARLYTGVSGERAGWFESDYTEVGAWNAALTGKFTGIGAIDGYGVEGHAIPQDGYGTGGYFLGGSTGVYGLVMPSGGGTYYGMKAIAMGGSGSNLGLYGWATQSSLSCIGVIGIADGTGTNYGVYGRGENGTTNYAGYFFGDVEVTGTLSKGAGSFKIDHPLDPENKYLYHSFVESPDMMNVYNGNAVTDADGLATVNLPDYFDALNKDFRYQLTVIGQFAQAIVAREIAGNRFTIQTDKPRVKVSWQVTGIRQDAYANAHRIPTEELKPKEERGLYIHPEAFGLDAARGIDAKLRAVTGSRDPKIADDGRDQ